MNKKMASSNRTDLRQKLEKCLFHNRDLITRLLLEEMGIPEECSLEVLQSLNSKMIVNWASLTVVESKEEMIEFCGGLTLSGRILWKGVQDYKRRAEGVSMISVDNGDISHGELLSSLRHFTLASN